MRHFLIRLFGRLARSTVTLLPGGVFACANAAALVLGPCVA